MFYLDRKFSILLLFFCIPLLFLPKFNLLNVDAQETAGLRLDDLVLFFLGIVLIWVHGLTKQKLGEIEGWILGITIFGFISFFINRLLVSAEIIYLEAKIYYTIRFLEYFLFFYLGIIFSKYFSHHLLIKAFFVWNFAIMILQKLQIGGGISSAGYVENVSGRVQGIASFPSEMGLLLNILFCYFIFEPAIKSQMVRLFSSPLLRQLLAKFHLYILFCLFGLLISLTGNRISLAALVMCFVFRLKQELSLSSMIPTLSALVFIPLVAIVLGLSITKSDGVFARSADLLTVKNLELFSIVWDKIDVSQNPMGNEVIESTHYDTSWWLRIHKWLFMAKSYLNHPECYLQGLGPGYAGAALDGGILRILTEYGIIGFFLFWRFFQCLYRINVQSKWIIISFLINMIFFDAHLAYKTMSLLLFICGSFYYYHNKQFYITIKSNIML